MSEKLIAYKDIREYCDYVIPNCELIEQRSDIGDLIIPQLELCIENKSMLDLFMSIVDGRIYRQAEKMQEYRHKYLYLKLIDINRMDEIKQKAIETIIIKLDIIYNIKTIKVKNQFMLNYSVNKLVELLANKDEILQEHYIKSYGGFESDFDRVVMAISCAEGIGIKLSKSIVIHFKSIENMVNQGEKGFSVLEGIGNTKSMNIYKFLHEPVEQKQKDKK